MKYYSAIKNKIPLFATTWIELENIMLSEISQTGKDKYCAISLICGFQKIIQMNVYAKQKQTHRYRKQSYLYQMRVEREEGQTRGMGLTDTNYYV